jgi:hypothetical protein
MEELQPGAGHLLILKKDPGSEHVCFESVYIYIEKIEPFVLKVKSWMKPSEMEMQPAKKHSEFTTNIAINGLVNCMLYKAT